MHIWITTPTLTPSDLDLLGAMANSDRAIGRIVTPIVRGLRCNSRLLKYIMIIVIEHCRTIPSSAAQKVSDNE
jgi:hypothetical protein